VSFLLYADDHEPHRNMVRDLLQASGHEVALAADGASALALLHEREPDLLILDVSMPGLSGIDVCRAVKDNPFTARVPILMLTGEDTVDSKVAGFDAGADDYLTKPFHPRELRARVQALVRLVRREGDRNPTSGLPGGRAIEEAIAQRVAIGRPFAVGYIDVDHFKPFNDVFGFAAADAVIRGTGDALRDALGETGAAGDFVGHIGGDDFVFVTDPTRAEGVARASARHFAAVVERVVDPVVMATGRYWGLDREERGREFPLPGVSCAILIVSPRGWRSAIALGARAAELKHRAKQAGGGAVLIDSL
jgi:PleD family two-component response regulator